MKNRSGRPTKGQRPRERTQDILFGINPITEAIKAGRRKIFQIIHKEGLQGAPAASLLSLARTKGIQVTTAPMEKVVALAGGADGSQGIVAMVSPPVYSSFDKLLDQLAAMDNPIVAALDGVMDPRNLGAIIRSAEAFGLAAVIFPERRAASYTAVAAKASAGAGEHMRLCPVVN
ncbi:MAG: 23S rRNA (guanosine(2251)-2'-O)-methyltransferase RlmB, partial [Nitrospinota bacterium]|nr:23S rRNA (guanosine(2251)-2'-O)-methyltransferase RlmB [Nitrospinota bacterium]